MNRDELVYLAHAAALSYTPPTLDEYKILQDSGRRTRGFMKFEHAAVVVAISGTKSLKDFLTDGAVFRAEVEIGSSPARFATIHMGFLLEFREIVTQILAFVDARPGYPVWLSGHSLGAALATLAAVSIREEYPNRDIKLLTLGSPRLVDRRGAKYIEGLGIDHVRVVHGYDFVPRIPKLGWWHVSDCIRLADDGRVIPPTTGLGAEIKYLWDVLKSDVDWESPRDHHVLDYVRAIEGYASHLEGGTA